MLLIVSHQHVVPLHIIIARLYFSAHWCPPCRKFTPLLAEAYNAHKKFLLEEQEDGTTTTNNEEANNNAPVGEIEVIFISLDSVQSEYDTYRSNTMPWLSVPFANLHKLRIKDALSKKYSVAGIPYLVVLDSFGEVVTKKGRGEYAVYFRGEYQKGGASVGCVVS